MTWCLPHEHDNILEYLIEEEIINYRYKTKQLSGKRRTLRLFPVIVKKLEKTLKLKHATNIENVLVKFKTKLKGDMERQIYCKKFRLNDLIDSKIVIPQCDGWGWGAKNRNSICYKTILCKKNEWDIYENTYDNKNKIQTTEKTQGVHVMFSLYKLHDSNGNFLGNVELDYMSLNNPYYVEFIIL